MARDKIAGRWAKSGSARTSVLLRVARRREKNYDSEIDAESARVLRERLKSSPVDSVNLPEVQKQIREQVKAAYQVVQPGYSREWQINLGFAKNYLRGKPLQLRVKFNAANKSSSGTISRVVAGRRAGNDQFLADGNADESRAGHGA